MGERLFSPTVAGVVVVMSGCSFLGRLPRRRTGRSRRCRRVRCRPRQDCGGGSSSRAGRDPHLGSVWRVVVEPGERGQNRPPYRAVTWPWSAITAPRPSPAGRCRATTIPASSRDVDVGISETGGDGDGAVVQLGWHRVEVPAGPRPGPWQWTRRSTVIVAGNGVNGTGRNRSRWAWSATAARTPSMTVGRACRLGGAQPGVQRRLGLFDGDVVAQGSATTVAPLSGWPSRRRLCGCRGGPGRSRTRRRSASRPRRSSR